MNTLGTKHGVFRTYPGHQSQRDYDPTIRPWYYKGIEAGGDPTVSTPYLDASGMGKVVTLTQAVLEGRSDAGANSTSARNSSSMLQTPAPSATPAPRPRASARALRVEAVLGLDFLYSAFEERMIAHTVNAPDAASGRHCGSRFSCGVDADSEDIPANCSTECFLLDESALVVMHPSLSESPEEVEVEYHDIPLAMYEGEVVRQLSAAGLLTKQEYFDFQGVCYHTPQRELKATSVAPRMSAQAYDDRARLGGHFPVFSNKYDCQKHVVVHTLRTPDLFPTQRGRFQGPCNSGVWTLTRVPGTKLFLLVIDERQENPINEKVTFSISCHTSNSLHRPGAIQAAEGTCSRVVDQTKSKLLPAAQCFDKFTVEMPCRPVAAAPGRISPVYRGMYFGLALLALCVGSSF